MKTVPHKRLYKYRKLNKQQEEWGVANEEDMAEAKTVFLVWMPCLFHLISLPAVLGIVEGERYAFGLPVWLYSVVASAVVIYSTIWLKASVWPRGAIGERYGFAIFMIVMVMALLLAQLLMGKW